jgi:hypothetical protein
VDPRNLKWFWEKALDDLNEQLAPRGLRGQQVFVGSSYFKHCLLLINGIMFKGGTPSQALLAFVRLYVACYRDSLLSWTIRRSIARLVTGTYPRRIRLDDPCDGMLQSLDIDKWASDSHHLERQYWDFAAASRELMEWYRGADCDFDCGTGFRQSKSISCCHARAEPLLLWLQQKAWSEVRFGLAISFGTRLSRDEHDLLFATVAKVEGIQTRPTPGALITADPPYCRPHQLLRRVLNGQHITWDDEMQLLVETQPQREERSVDEFLLTL